MMLLCRILITIFLISSLQSFAQSDGAYLVLGAIGSGADSNGVVLLKRRQNDSAFAVKVGTEVEKGIIVFKLSDRFVYFKRGTEMIRVKIGDELEQYAKGTSSGLPGLSGKPEIEVRDNKVTMSAKYKDHLVKHELSRILMQAAAVPFYQNGVLEGFKMVDIDDDSIYDQVGLEDGDIVTEINGQKLSDVGMAIKVLNSLREAKQAEIRFIRAGNDKSIEVSVQ
jgi:type II secretion system protein C